MLNGVKREWRTEDGSVWLMQGDCLEILPQLEGIDAIVTDPPYGLGIAANPVRQAHQRMDWDDAPASMVHIDMLLHRNVPTILWGGNYFPMPPAKCILCWNKLQPEDFSLAMCEYAWTNIDKPSKMFTRRVVGYEKQHPTQKPIDLMVWCLKQILGEWQTAADPFCGSGTTLLAAHQLGKRCIGIEREPAYFDTAVARIHEEIARTALLEPVPKITQRSMFEEQPNA